VKTILESLDYREWLRELYEERKLDQPWYSLRLMGTKLGIDSAWLLRIMQKEEHISLKSLSKVLDGLGLQGNERAYFEVMVHFARAKSEQEKKTHFEAMMQLRGVSTKTLVPLQFIYFSSWHYSAIFAAIGAFRVNQNFEELGQLLTPSISKEQAQEAVALLETLGLVKLGDDGFYNRLHDHISTGPEVRSQAVRDFQKEMIRLASESLDRHPKEERDISALTINMSQQTLEDIREILRNARQSIKKRVDQDQETDCCYQVNMQVFPIVRKPPRTRAS
jgi:uncharacterized protein (TIGR02147 family)